MESDDDKTAGWFQHALGGDQRAGDFAQLVIDENTQRLERPRRRMNTDIADAQYAGNDLG